MYTGAEQLSFGTSLGIRKHAFKVWLFPCGLMCTISRGGRYMVKNRRKASQGTLPFPILLQAAPDEAGPTQAVAVTKLPDDHTPTTAPKESQAAQVAVPPVESTADTSHLEYWRAFYEHASSSWNPSGRSLRASTRR